MHLLGQIWKFIRVYRKIWMGPIIVLMLLLGGLLIFAQSSAFAPFLYAIF
ncbi:MAG: hypothetical protein HQL73_03080 [Magnetococcales bacterium]|nr:hypothetical protein [Magnetococcales bacterium]